MMQQRRPARPYVRPVDASPHTPSGRPHDRINSIFENLELHWRLGLTPRDDKTWSPSHSRARETSGQYQCSQKLKLLYFKGADHLDKALKEFNANAHQKAPKDRLPYLRRLLDDGLKRANTKAEASASRTPLQRRLEQVASSSASLPRSGATSIFNPPRMFVSFAFSLSLLFPVIRDSWAPELKRYQFSFLLSLALEISNKQAPLRESCLNCRLTSQI